MNETSAGMRLLITGASGFIGSRLAQIAARDGWRVTPVTAVNNEAERRRCEMLNSAGMTPVIAPLEDADALGRLLRNQDVVIHLAAAQHEAQQPESYFRRINVEGTHRLLTLACAAGGITRFVYGSTIGVYGGTADDAVLDEASPIRPDNPYGRTKAEAERVVRDFAANIPVSIVRISETYGPGDLRLLKLFRGIARGRYVTLGRGLNEHQLIYVDDLARGVLLAATTPAAIGETLVLAGAKRVTTHEMADAVAAAVGHSGRVRHLPLRPFDIAARAFEATFKPLGLRPPLHRRRLDFFRKSFRFSTAKAEQVLGFRAEITFAEGARLTAQWYRENGFL